MSKSKEFYHIVDCQTSLPKRMDILRKISFLKGIFYLVWIFKLRVILVFTVKFTRKFRIPPSCPYTVLLIIVCSVDILCDVFYNSWTDINTLLSEMHSLGFTPVIQFCKFPHIHNVMYHSVIQKSFTNLHMIFLYSFLSPLPTPGNHRPFSSFCSFTSNHLRLASFS